MDTQNEVMIIPSSVVRMLETDIYPKLVAAHILGDNEFAIELLEHSRALLTITTEYYQGSVEEEAEDLLERIRLLEVEFDKIEGTTRKELNLLH